MTNVFNVFLTLSAYNINNVTSNFYIKNKNVGTGNILFQIASSLNYAFKNNATLFVPCLNTYFRLEGLNKKDTIYRLINTDIINDFNELNSIYTYDKTDYYIFNQPFYNNIHFRGYFENFQNFDENKELILNYFKPTEENKKYIFDKYPIIKDNNISSIHIRMGPDIKNYYTSERINIIENTYFELIDHMIEFKKVNKFMVLTNDVEYCQNLFKSSEKFKNIDFFYSNETIDFIDIWIISLIKNNIISFSTFSLWGSYLNENEDKYIVGSSKTVKEKLKYHEWVYI
uniref:Glycosyl transferase family 11 n=1 Tax=viral metagenome TaxID=1070528 RepID=A0A6C0EQE0_9ZZZZ